MKYRRTIKFARLSDKYVSYFENCKTHQINCMEGAFRAGKTVVNILSFAQYLELCEDKLHLVSGASEATARLNVADCNGYGLTYLFAGRCKTGRYEDNACLKIQTKTGEKIIIFVGGGKADSYKRIQGLSFGSWLSVELANLFISDDEKCFIDMAISRLTQSKNRRIWWDLNPVYPNHKVYKKYIDAMMGMEQFNYLQCSLFDNTALSDKQRDNYLSTFSDKDSMEYRRYVLGERAAANGLIFKQFAVKPLEKIVTNRSEFLRGIQPQFISIGVDFGGNKSNTTFVASCLYNNYAGVYIVASDIMIMAGGETDAKDFRDRFKQFIKTVSDLGIAPIRYAFGDCADRVMIAEMRNAIRELGVQIKVADSVKKSIKERIDVKRQLMATNRWWVSKNAKSVIESTKTQVWNQTAGHEDERLDDGTADIDTADAEEYSWSAFIGHLLASIKRGT